MTSHKTWVRDGKVKARSSKAYTHHIQAIVSATGRYWTVNIAHRKLQSTRQHHLDFPAISADIGKEEVDKFIAKLLNCKLSKLEFDHDWQLQTQ